MRKQFHVSIQRQLPLFWLLEPSFRGPPSNYPNSHLNTWNWIQDSSLLSPVLKISRISFSNKQSPMNGCFVDLSRDFHELQLSILQYPLLWSPLTSYPELIMLVSLAWLLSLTTLTRCQSRTCFPWHTRLVTQIEAAIPFLISHACGILRKG